MPSDRKLDESPVQGNVRRPVSNRWLLAAVVATLAGVALVLVLFVGLQATTFDPGLGGGVSGAGGSEDALVFVVARTPGGPTEWSNWARVIKSISEDVGRPVTVRYLTKEQEAADVIANEEFDVAFICMHQYLNLSEQQLVEGLCTPVIDGSATCTYMMLVAPDDPATSLEDLEGATVSASDRSSLGGYSYLSYICGSSGLSSMEFFGEVRLGDSQEQSLRDLANGDARAAVINTAQAVEWDLSAYKVIEESPPVGTPPVVVSPDLDADLRERLRRAFVEFESAESLGEDSHIDGFMPFDPGLYIYAEEIRNACGHH